MTTPADPMGRPASVVVFVVNVHDVPAQSWTGVGTEVPLMNWTLPVRYPAPTSPTLGPAASAGDAPIATATAGAQTRMPRRRLVALSPLMISLLGAPGV